MWVGELVGDEVGVCVGTGVLVGTEVLVAPTVAVDVGTAVEVDVAVGFDTCVIVGVATGSDVGVAVAASSANVNALPVSGSEGYSPSCIAQTAKKYCAKGLRFSTIAESVKTFAAGAILPLEQFGAKASCDVTIKFVSPGLATGFQLSAAEFAVTTIERPVSNGVVEVVCAAPRSDVSG